MESKKKKKNCESLLSNRDLIKNPRKGPADRGSAFEPRIQVAQMRKQDLLSLKTSSGISPEFNITCSLKAFYILQTILSRRNLIFILYCNNVTDKER